MYTSPEDLARGLLNTPQLMGVAMGSYGSDTRIARLALRKRIEGIGVRTDQLGPKADADALAGEIITKIHRTAIADTSYVGWNISEVFYRNYGARIWVDHPENFGY